MGITTSVKKYLIIGGTESPHLYKNIVDVSRTELSYLNKILNRAVTHSKYGHMDKGRLIHFGIKEEQARQESQNTFTNDTRDYMETLHGEALIDFKRQWGIVPPSSYLRAMSTGRVAVFDIDASLYNLDKISEEILEANRMAAHMYTHTRELCQQAKGYLLLCLFLSDIMGRRSLEGRLFSQKIQEEMYQHELPSMAHKYTVYAYIIGMNVFMLLWSLYVAGYDSNRFFDSFFYVTFACTLGLDMMTDVFMKVIYDFMIPNTIHNHILYAKHECEKHINSVISSEVPFHKYESYSSSRYLHASYFYADTFESSLEKSFVMTYINSHPGMTGYLWNKLPRNFLPSIPSRLAIMLNIYIPRRLFVTLLLIMSCFFTTGLLMAINRIFGTVPTYLVLLSFILFMVLVAVIDRCIIERKAKKLLISQVVPMNSDVPAATKVNPNLLTPPESAEALEGENRDKRREAFLIHNAGRDEDGMPIGGVSSPQPLPLQHDRREAFLIHNAGRDENGMPIGTQQPNPAETTLDNDGQEPGISTLTLQLDMDDDMYANKSVDVSLDEMKKEPSPSYRISVASSPMSNIASSPMYESSQRHREGAENEMFSFSLGNNQDDNNDELHEFGRLQHESFHHLNTSFEVGSGNQGLMTDTGEVCFDSNNDNEFAAMAAVTGQTNEHHHQHRRSTSIISSRDKEYEIRGAS